MMLSIIIFIAIGYRIWAFVYSFLFSSATQTIVYIFFIPWRRIIKSPDFNEEIKSLLKFGAFSSLELFQGWLLNYGDNLIVGYFLGIEALGMYALAFNIAVYSLYFVIQPLSSISYSAFSNMQSDIAEVRRAFINILQVSSMLIIPLGQG